MLLQGIRPSNIVGIKRLARQIRNAEGIPYHQALQRAANAASYDNFEHARRALRDTPHPLSRNQQIFLTAYWTDRDTYEKGRETLALRLSKPLSKLCSKPEMKLVRALCNMRLASPDHLVKDMLCPSQEFARSQICQAVRALRFMEATGLRPCDHRRADQATKRLEDELPGKDHCSEWYDPVSGQVILIDEPYSRPLVSADRAAWAARNNWYLRASSWAGMYLPYRCALFVASNASGTFDFDALMQKIDAIPAPITTEKWDGVSADDHMPFTSPLAISPQDKRRAKAKGTIVPRPSKQTIPYVRSFIGAARKPNGAMTLIAHQSAGRMIKAILQSRHKPWAVNRQMDRLNSTLVDWLYEDVSPRLFGDMDPVDVYYGAISDDDPLVAQAGSTRGVMEILFGLHSLLTGAYPDCEPLRRIVQKVEAAQAIIENAENVAVKV